MSNRQRRQDSSSKETATTLGEEGCSAPQQSFRMLFECAPDAMFLANIDTGIIEEANQAAAKLLLRAKEEIVGLHFSMLHPPEMLETSKKHFHTHVLQSQAAGELAPIEYFALRADGSTVPIEIMSATLTIDQRKKLLGIFRDISGRRRMEAELREHADRLAERSLQLASLNETLEKELKAREQMESELRNSRENLEKRVEERTLELQKTYGQLLHAEKLSAVGSLSASIAHEFNNPLQSVMTITRGILSHSSLSEQEKELLDLSLKECGRMRDLIRNLQDFNRPSSGQLAPTSLNNLIDCILLLAKYQYKRRKIMVVREYAADLPQIMAVADQVKQVLINLLNNAADACEEGGGIITVRTAIAAGGYVNVVVKDSGKGIPAEILPRIFEPFFTTKPEPKGTGLGLSVSQDIVKRHGGRIEVASKVGRGTTFTVILPVNGLP